MIAAGTPVQKQVGVGEAGQRRHAEDGYQHHALASNPIADGSAEQRAGRPRRKGNRRDEVERFTESPTFR